MLIPPPPAVVLLQACVAYACLYRSWIQVVLCKQATSAYKLHARPPGGTIVDVIEATIVYNCCVTAACKVELWLMYALTTWRVSKQNGSPMRKP